MSSQFNGQLTRLMGVLRKTTSHFVRCIKPNELQRPHHLEPTSVMTQLRYSGMCAALVLMQVRVNKRPLVYPKASLSCFYKTHFGLESIVMG